MGIEYKQGENVLLSFMSDSPATANKVVIYDANQNVRTLLATERLIIDSWTFATEASDTTHLAFLVAAASAPSALPAGGIVAEFAVGAVGIGSQSQHIPGEGKSLPVGQNLWLLLVGDSWSSKETSISCTGRIVNGTTTGPSANYKQLLTPGGNNSWQ